MSALGFPKLSKVANLETFCQLAAGAERSNSATDIVGKAVFQIAASSPDTAIDAMACYQKANIVMSMKIENL